MVAMTRTTHHLIIHLFLTLFLHVSSDDFCPSVDPYLASVDEDDADVTVGAVLRLHGPGRGVYGCGAPDAEGLHYYEALRWATGALNKNEGVVFGVNVSDSFIPGIKIGLRVYDSCGHREVALKHLTELFPIMKSGSEECAGKDNASTVIGALDMSASLQDPRVAETAGRYIIPVIPLRQETTAPPEQLAKVLAEVVHDMDWERVSVVHADDEYSIFVTKVFSQLTKGGQTCISSIRPLPKEQDHRKSYHRTLASLASKLPDNTGVIVIGSEEVFKKILQVISEAPSTLSRLQWLFSWILPFQDLEVIRTTLKNRQIFSLSPYPQEIATFEDYWRRLGDTSSAQDTNDRFFVDYAMHMKNCRTAGHRSLAHNNIAVCENLVLNEKPSDQLLRTARFLPALHSLYTFAHAYRKAWQAKCRGVPGSCLNLRRMGRSEFVEAFLEPLEFIHSPEERSPPGVQGQKTALGNSGEMEGMRLALNAYTDRDGIQFKQVLTYDSKEAKVVDPTFRYIPSECPKEGCKDCITARQSRFEDPYVGMASSSEMVIANDSDDISIPILLPIHKPGRNPLECSDEINPEAVQDLEAALWTVDQINRDTEFLPEIRLGVVVVDTCSTPVQITQKLSNYLLDTKKKDLDDFTSDLAFVAVGSPEEIAAANSVISSLNVTTISVTDSLRQKDVAGKHHLLQIAVPFEKKTKATVDTLRYLGWNYVTVIHDGDRRSEIMLESFKNLAKTSDICVSVELATSGSSDKEMDDIVKAVVAAKKKGARAVVMWTNEKTTRSFLQGVHRAVLSGLVSRGDLVIISSGDWIVNLQSFKEFENEATGVIVLKTQQGEVEDFATYYQRLQPESNKRNVWFRELWEQRKECIDTKCEMNMSGIPVEYKPSTSTVNIIQGLLAISAGLARLRNELCHPEPGLCPKMLQTPQLRQHLYSYIKETASSRLDAKGEMFAFTKQGYGNLPIEIFNFRRAAGKNFVYQKVGTYDTHLNNLAEIVVYNSKGEEITVDQMTSDCIEDCGVCEKRPTDFVVLDSKDRLYLATSVDIHDSSPNPLSCGSEVTTSGLQTMEAFLWALDQVNSSPQILPGINLGAIVFDTCSSKEKAARDIANFFSSAMSTTSPTPKLPGVNQILGLVATQTDNVIQPIIDVAMPFKMMTLAPRVTSTSFNNLEKYPSLLRPSLPNDIRAGGLVDLLKHFKWDFVSVLHSESEADMFESFRTKALAKEIEFAMGEKMSPSFSNAAMKILLEKLKGKQKEGAKVVVLFLDTKCASNLFAVVQDALSAGRMDTGDLVWLSFDSVDAFHMFPMAALGAVTMQPMQSTVYPFTQHFGTLSPRNNSRNPWFREYWEQLFKCRGSGCDHRHQTLSELSLLQDPSISKVVNSVLALGLGLESLRQHLCPGTDRGLCPAMLHMDNGKLRDSLFNLTSEGSFPGAGGKPFRFTSRRFAANNLDVLNFRQVGSNAHAFVNVGTYSPDEGLSLNFSKIRTYNEFGKEISLYDIKSTCKDCKRNTADKFTTAMQIVPKQDFAILAIMPVHGKGASFFECGSFRDERMFHHLTGIAYAVDKINRNSTLMPGVDIGTVVFDYCDRPQRGQDQLYSFFSKDHASNANGLRVKPKSVVAAMTYGTGISKESSAIFESLNLMQVATPIDRMEPSAFNDILYTAPSTMSQIQALLSILKKFNWMYVNIVYSNTDFGRSGYYQFAKEAKEMDVCLANVVLVEPNSKRDSILTNLQNGLNRDATVVVSLIDDDQVVQNLVEAIKISGMLSKHVWVGTETWGNNPTVISSLQDATFDAITLKLESHDMPDFNKYYEGLTVNNHFPIPDAWFDEFWQHRFQCQLPNSEVHQKRYTSLCTGNERLSSDELSHREHVYQTVKTVQSVTEGLHNFLSRKCPFGMAAMNIDDCGGSARSELKMEIEAILHGSYSDCEECTSSTTIFGYDIFQHSIVDNLTNVRNQIGSWKDGLIFLDESKISFSYKSIPKSECQEDCGQCKEQKGSLQNSLVSNLPIWANFQTVWGIVVTSLSILGILMVIICALYFLMSFPVTVGTTVLGYMILFGLLLLYAVNFSFVLQPTEGTCGIRRFGLGLAYAIVFSGMLVKVMNTWRLMGYNGARILSDGTRLSSPAGLLVIAVGLVIIQVVLSAAWLILMPPRTGAWEGAFRCAPPTTFEEGLVVSLVYAMLLLAITALFAMLTWQCQDNNKESRWILACTLTVGMVWLAWTVLSTQLPVRYRDAAICTANLANATIIMVCLYLRKVYLYSKLSRQARDQDLKTHLQPGSYTHSIYGSSQKTFSTLAPVLYGSQASLTTKKIYAGPSSRVELINCPEDNKSDSSSGGSVQVQATDLYPLDMYDGGSQFQPISSLYGSNHTLVLDDTLPFGR